MGRKHYTARTPQHSRHARERSRGIEASQPFGVHRVVESGTATRIMYCLRELQAAGELPPNMKIEKRPHVPLAPMHLMGVQLEQGIIRKDPRRMQRKLEDMFADQQPPAIAADIADIRVQRERHVQLIVDSPSLEEERAQVVGELSDQGVKGLYTWQKDTSLAVRLGYTTRPLNGDQRRQIEDVVMLALDDVHRLEEPVPLGAWATYSQSHGMAA